MIALWQSVFLSPVFWWVSWVLGCVFFYFSIDDFKNADDFQEKIGIVFICTVAALSWYMTLTATIVFIIAFLFYKAVAKDLFAYWKEKWKKTRRELKEIQEDY